MPLESRVIMRFRLERRDGCFIEAYGIYYYSYKVAVVVGEIQKSKKKQKEECNQICILVHSGEM